MRAPTIRIAVREMMNALERLLAMGQGRERWGESFLAVGLHSVSSKGRVRLTARYGSEAISPNRHIATYRRRNLLIAMRFAG
jgi:hypothetical protein